MNSNTGLREYDWKIIKEAISSYSEIEEAILFGSRAKGTYRTGSDVDIALVGKKINHSIISGISLWLNEETLMPYKFDVVHFNKIQSPDLIEHIKRAGISFYKKTSIS